MSYLSKVINQRFIEAKTAINTKLQISKYLADNGIAVESNRRICCPLHDDSTPSFSVNFNTNEWKCFGCPDGGHYVDIWMKLTNKRTGSKYTIYSAIEQILKLNPSICDELGFKTIYETYNEEFDLFKSADSLTADETNVFAFDEKLKQPAPVKQVETETIEKVMHKLRTADIDTIIQFITDCELGMSEDLLIAKYYHEQNAVSDFISNLSMTDDTVIKDALLEALNND